MISGILNINKPQGMTSHDIVARIRKLSGQRKVGHTGTLDPMATGVLVVCLGHATRLIEYLQLGLKRYQGTIHFGISTNTLDADGQIVSEHNSSHLTEEQLRKILPNFQGQIEQTPPLFSALKKDGKPLYKFARAGEAVEIKSRCVTIESLEWVSWHPPQLTLDIVCSPGTYIRSLARDLGEAVGTGAHLTALTRTVNSSWCLAEAVALEILEAEINRDKMLWQKYLHPMDEAVRHLRKVTLTADDVRRTSYGQRLELPEIESDIQIVRAYTSTGDFLAILTRVPSDDKLWQPKKVFHSGGTQ